MRDFCLKLLFLFTLSFITSAYAQELDYQYNIDWLPVYTYKKLPAVNYARQSAHTLSNDLRLESKIQYKGWQAVLRPRAIADSQLDDELSNSRSGLRAFFNEAFLARTVNDEMDLSAGRLNYQWGPAELVSWSNSLFHFNYDYRSFFYIEKGKYLVKGSYTPSKNVSFVVLAEVLNEHMKTDYEDSLLAQEYKRKALLKSEIVFEKASDYAGLTLATGEVKSKHLGLYGAYGLTEAISFYTDSRLSFANSYYELLQIGPYQSWKLVNDDYDKVKPLASVGIRYESSYDLRFEYIYNSLGLNNQQMQKALGSLNYANPYALANLLILNKSGRELLGRQYFYTSLRLPDLGQNENMTLFLRHFLSLQDYSFTVQLNLERSLTDSLVGYIETDSAFGNKMSELKFLNQFTGRIGGRWTF